MTSISSSSSCHQCWVGLWTVPLLYGPSMRLSTTSHCWIGEGGRTTLWASFQVFL
ncbi:hypothetical protein PISMIDRAFT_686334 [Pisolithus microcarpus 441]|uniref:Uncharacterized protein n=1 Tax=Pisolithus microcarpus 441 TaxID=765257 RepID=A0A0C9YI93_9AGAM|nr:hypothetical protein PISMIDRAFT_686334 [Pisolithus microcarpus 441]